MTATRKRIRCTSCRCTITLPRGADAGIDTCDRCFFGNDRERMRRIRQIRIDSAIAGRGLS